MIEYLQEANKYLETPSGRIADFTGAKSENADWETIDSFGEEWSKFSTFSETEIKEIGDEYFDIVPKAAYGADKVALDMGCGTGRWSLYAAPKFSHLEAIDPSDAIFTAAQNAKGKNIRLTKAEVDFIPFADNSFDFVFSLGVLHHIPDTQDALIKCVKKLKPGGYFLLYLYYKLDNRGALYKGIFFLVDLLRKLISRLPGSLKRFSCDLIAILVYGPMVLLAWMLKKLGLGFWRKIPLSYYVGKSFFVMRNDALDRFGTPLEQRFSRSEIKKMMEVAGLKDIQFSDHQPYWHAIGKKQ